MVLFSHKHRQIRNETDADLTRINGISQGLAQIYPLCRPAGLSMSPRKFREDAAAEVGAGVKASDRATTGVDWILLVPELTYVVRWPSTKP